MGLKTKPAHSAELAKRGWNWQEFEDGSGSFYKEGFIRTVAAQYDKVTGEYRVKEELVLTGGGNWVFYDGDFDEVVRKVERFVEKVELFDPSKFGLPARNMELSNIEASMFPFREYLRVRGWRWLDYEDGTGYLYRPAMGEIGGYYSVPENKYTICKPYAADFPDRLFEVDSAEPSTSIDEAKAEIEDQIMAYYKK